MSWLRIFNRASALFASLSLLVASTAHAGVSVTVEAPGVQYSTQSGPLKVETFDTAATPIGFYTSINSVVGKYVASGTGAYVSPANDWGGSDQTQYIAVGAQSGQLINDLYLPKSLDYFGFYFGAMDYQNAIEVYDGANLLMTITRDSLTPLLTNTGGPFGLGHYGNPNQNGVNTGEPYAFVNIFGTDGQTFDRIRFVNDGTGTGLETDSHTIRGVPEPSSFVLAALGGLAVLGVRLRKRASRSEGNS
jgi:hypothetical protein